MTQHKRHDDVLHSAHGKTECDPVGEHLSRNNHLAAPFFLMEDITPYPEPFNG